MAENAEDSARPKRNGRRRAMFVGLLGAFLLAYWPLVGMSLSRLGIQLAEPIVLGKRIEMSNGWFAAWSSTSTLGKAVGSPTYASIVFLRPNGFWPVAPHHFVIGEIGSGFDMKSVDVCREESFQWGQARFVCLKGENVPKTVMLDQFGLVATGDNLQAVADIKAISRGQ